MTINYDDCSKFIRDKLKITLFPYQEIMLKAFCEGKEVRSARCTGRSVVANAVGKYMAYKLDKNNYGASPDIVLPYHCALNHNLMSREQIEEIRSLLSQEDFNREYLCE